MNRPTVVEAMESFGPYGRLADLLAVPVPLPTTVRSHDESGHVMQSSFQPLRGRTIPLASITVEPAAEWRQQRDRIARIIQTSTLKRALTT